MEWCILIGNDFTGTDNFPRNFFSPLPDMNPLRKISDDDEDEDREDEDEDDEEEEEEEVQEEGEGGTYEDENGDCDAGLDKKVSETRECMYVCMYVCCMYVCMYVCCMYVCM